MCAIVCRNLYLGIFEFPIKEISLILGNDLAGSKVMPDLQRVSNPTATMGVNAVESSIFQLVLSPEQQQRGHRRKTMRLLLQLTQG